MAELKSAGIIDFCCVRHAATGPDYNFVSACNNLGVSPIFNNGNDGIPGWDGTEGYYQNIANAGFHAAGGESEPQAEILACERYLPFLNYGGEYGGCGYNFTDIFSHTMVDVNASGHGIVSILETYIGIGGTHALCPNETVTAVVHAKQHGCAEVGLLIGVWMGAYGYGAQSYIDIINAIEARGVTVNTIHWWGGYGTDGNQHFHLNGNDQILNSLKAIWPPNMTTMKDRLAGVSPTPPGPTPPPPGPTPPSGGKQMKATSDLDITPYMTKMHNGQPTRGVHSVKIWPITPGQFNVGVNVREYQKGLE